MRRFPVLCLTLIFVGLSLSHGAEKKFLERYTGQSTAQLIALARDHRIDSLVLAFEQALEQKGERRKLTQAELDVLAVEAMEREVNNGGYRQFFGNASNQYAALLPSALERIGCPTAAKISAEALACLKIRGPVTAAKIEAALRDLRPETVSELAKCDQHYFQNAEPIADQLFGYIQAKQSDIVLR